jgi:2-polyprenyl-3-methyl-5-hydroxy-6-metoxy-1,4-benzoquinol methylase
MGALEVGCGTGSNAIAHAAFVKHIRATDVSGKMLEIARAKAKAAGVSNVTFQQATVEGLDVPDKTVDMVLALSVLHLLKDMVGAIVRMYRMLKPGGALVSSTACIADFMRWFGVIAPLGLLVGLIPYVRVFTRQELAASLTGAGFVIDQTWSPGRGKAVFHVALKPTTPP